MTTSPSTGRYRASSLPLTGRALLIGLAAVWLGGVRCEAQGYQLDLTSIGTRAVNRVPILLHATLRNAANQPAANETVEFGFDDPASTAEPGLQRTQAVTNQNGVAEVSAVPVLPQGNTVGAQVVYTASATVAGSPAIKATDVTVTVLPAGKIALDPIDVPATVVAGKPATVLVNVRSTTLVFDQFPSLSGVAVTARRRSGTVTPEKVTAVSDPLGEIGFTLTFGLGTNEVIFTVGDTDLSATVDATAVRTVVAVAGPVDGDRSTLSLSPTQVPADGQTAAGLTIVLRDQAGNLVSTGFSDNPNDDFSLSATTGGQPNSTVTATFVTTTTAGEWRGQVMATEPGLAVLSVSVRDPITKQLVRLKQTVTLEVQAFFALRLQPGLNLVGSPLTLNSASPTDVWSALRPMLVARYLSTADAYEVLDPVAPTEAFDVLPGRGFWLQTGDALEVKLSGSPLASQIYQAVVEPADWTLISLPTLHAVLWDPSRITALVNNQVVGTLANSTLFVAPYAWIWSAARQKAVLVVDPALGISGSTDTVPAGAGLWLRRGERDLGTGVLSLEFDFAKLSRAASGPAPAAQPSRDAWSLTLQAAGGERTGEATVGVASRLGRALDIAPPPLPGAGEPLLAVVRHGRACAAGIDAEPVEATGREWRLHLADSGAPEVVVSWPQANRALPRGYRAVLSDLASGRRISLRSGASLALPGGERELSLQVLRDNTDRLAVSLQARPGRGRAATLALTLSRAAEVKLRVVGLSGRQVKSWSAGELPAGSHGLAWDGTDQEGRPVPAGTYRVEAWASDELGEVASAATLTTVR